MIRLNYKHECIPNSHTIFVPGINEPKDSNLGITALVCPCDELFVIKLVQKRRCDDLFLLPMNLEKLNDYAEKYDYYSYAVCIASYMKEEYDVKGIKVEIKDNTVPDEYGLKSEAMSLLVVKGFNLIYNLGLTESEEKEIANY